MLGTRSISGFVVLVLLAGPAAAQTTPAGRSSTGAAAAPAAPAGRLQKSADGWRVTRLVGSNVYNGNESSSDRIGTVSDLLVDDSGKIKHAVLSVGGFLGIGRKLVDIPYEQLRFVEAPASPVPAGPRSVANPTPLSPTGSLPVPDPEDRVPPSIASQIRAPGIRIVLPGATRQSLRAHPAFKFAP